MPKLFVSYASEDREAFVQPLVDALESHHNVWFAPYELTLGDSLLVKISQGLRECDFGIVVLSPAFFSKKWPRNELDGLVALETAEEKIILPIWKDVSEEDVKLFSPILAGRLAVSASEGVDHVVKLIDQAVDAAGRVARFSPLDAIRTRLKTVAEAIAADRQSAQLLDSYEGAEKVYAAVETCLDALTNAVAEFASTLNLPMKTARGSPMGGAPLLHR